MQYTIVTNTLQVFTPSRKVPDQLLKRLKASPVVIVFSMSAASGLRLNSVEPGHVETPIYGDMPLGMLTSVIKTRLGT